MQQIRQITAICRGQGNSTEKVKDEIKSGGIENENLSQSKASGDVL